MRYSIKAYLVKCSSIGLIIIGLLSLESCKKAKEIGLEVQPENDKIGVFYLDTFSLATNQILLDSIPISNPSFMLAGAYSDSEMGEIETDAYFQVLPVGYNDNFVNNIYDSVALSIQGYNAYGDTNAPFELNVVRVLDVIDSGSIYNQSAKPTLGTILGSKTFIPKPTQTFLGNDRIYLKNTNGSQDTIHIKLNDDFGNEIFSKSYDELSKNENFTNLLKGICLKGNGQNKSILQFSVQTAISNRNLNLNPSIRVYYHTPENEKRFYDFELNSFSNRFNSFKANRNGKAISQLTKIGDSIPSTRLNNKLYLQGMSPYAVKINFNGLNDFIKNVGKIAINKVELIVPVESSDLQPIRYLTVYYPEGNKIERLSGSFLYNVIQTSQGILVPNDNYTTISRLTDCETFYNSETKSYSLNLTEYMFDLIAKKKSSKGIIIAPQIENISDRCVNNFVNRSILKDAKNMKLKVYYSPIKK